jgi:hypothetical protein
MSAVNTQSESLLIIKIIAPGAGWGFQKWGISMKPPVQKPLEPVTDVG